MNKQSTTCATTMTLLVMLMLCISFVEAQFGRKKKEEEAAAASAASEAESASQFGIDNQYVVLGGTAVAASLVSAIVMKLFGSGSSSSGSTKKGNKAGVKGTVDVVIVGCGLPKKGMGWYHLTQLLDMPKVNLRAVVEPFFLDSTLCKKCPESFKELVESVGALGVEFSKGVPYLSDFDRPTICLIAGRTHDNPKLFQQCVAKGAKCIFLEKPGAPSVEQLIEMKTLAAENDVKVYLGYNKNVTPYVQKALALSKTVPHAHVFFCHNNSYSKKDLTEVFSRNPEGMLKNMAIHELALLATFFGVTVDTVDKFRVNTNKIFSEKVTVWKPGTSMPDPEYISDFARVAFKITTKSGTNVSVMADRCGGNVSFAVVKDENGNEVKKFEFPDSTEMKKIDAMCKADPEMMPYFFVQSDDYLELKNRVVDSFLEGELAEGVATIDVAIEALKLAEYGTAELNKALDAVQVKE